jgi:hypothetical protein
MKFFADGWRNTQIQKCNPPTMRGIQFSSACNEGPLASHVSFTSDENQHRRKASRRTQKTSELPSSTPRNDGWSLFLGRILISLSRRHSDAKTPTVMASVPCRSTPHYALAVAVLSIDQRSELSKVSQMGYT